MTPSVCSYVKWKIREKGIAFWTNHTPLFTSVGFGNIAAETDNEKIFSICMMIVAGELLCYTLDLLLKPSLIGNNNPILKAVPKPSWQNCCKEKQIPRVNLQKSVSWGENNCQVCSIQSPLWSLIEACKNVWVERALFATWNVSGNLKGGESLILIPSFHALLTDTLLFFSPTLCHDFWSRDHDHPTDDLSYSQIPRHPEQVTFFTLSL